MKEILIVILLANIVYSQYQLRYTIELARTISEIEQECQTENKALKFKLMVKEVINDK